MDDLALAAAFGAAFDNPGQTVVCVVGDDVAESGATAAAWHSVGFLDPQTDGVVLPILHVKGGTVFAAMTDDGLIRLFEGLGWRPRVVDAVEDTEPGDMLILRHPDAVLPDAPAAVAPTPLAVPDVTAFDSLDGFLDALAGQPNVRIFAPERSLRSDQVCQGWMRGYVRSGRHGVFVGAATTPAVEGTYVLETLPTIADGERYRVYLPPDTNTLLVTLDRCLRSTGLVNVVVAPPDGLPSRLEIDAAKDHVAKGASVWDAGDGEPDIVLAACGSTATVELLAASELLREQVPELRVRVVNVVDLFALASSAAHPTGLSQAQFASVFTKDRPVLFAIDGPPSTIHQLLHRRPQQTRFHVQGPMTNRYELAIEALTRADLLAAEMLPGMSGEFAVRAVPDAEAAIQRFREALAAAG